MANPFKKSFKEIYQNLSDLRPRRGYLLGGPFKNLRPPEGDDVVNTNSYGKKMRLGSCRALIGSGLYPSEVEKRKEPYGFREKSKKTGWDVTKRGGRRL